MIRQNNAVQFLSYIMNSGGAMGRLSGIPPVPSKINVFTLCEFNGK